MHWKEINIVDIFTYVKIGTGLCQYQRRAALEYSARRPGSNFESVDWRYDEGKKENILLIMRVCLYNIGSLTCKEEEYD